MLNLHATTPPTSLLAATPLPAAANASAEGGGAPSAFARMLQGSQPPAASAPPAPQPPQRSGEQQAQQRHAEHNIEHQTERHGNPPHEAEGEAAAHGQAPGATAPSQAGNRTAPTGREAVRGRDEAKRAQPSRTSSTQAAAAQAEAAKRETAVDKKADVATAPDPALADWLASLKLPEPPPAALGVALATPAHASAAADPNQAGAPGSAQTSAGTTPGAGADAAAAAASGQAAVATLASGLPATAGSTSFDAAAASTGRERPSDPSVRGTGQADNPASEPAGAALVATAARPGAGDGQNPSPGGGNAGNAPPAWTPVSSLATASAAAMAPAPVTVFTVPAGRSQADPVVVNLPVPVESPAFPRAMGVELSVLARDGIEHAELHLSPAEMGPVSVQIAIDGTQARIDFGADVAATRQAIEAGLPELASALREAGLTLTGGGVSQHSRGQQNPADPSAAGRGNGGPADAGTGESAAPPPRRFVRAGGVDMYA